MRGSGGSGIKLLEKMAKAAKKKRLEIGVAMQTNLTDDHPPLVSRQAIAVDLRLKGEDRREMWDRVEMKIYFEVLQIINERRPRGDDTEPFYTSSGTQFVTKIQARSPSHTAAGKTATVTDEFKLAFSLVYLKGY